MNLRNNYIRLSLVSIFLLGVFILISSPRISLANDVPSDTSVEFGDVVTLNYTLWVDNNVVDFQEGTIYVEDPDVLNKDGFPKSIIEEFPDIYGPPNLGFVEGILGMRVGDKKIFLLNSQVEKDLMMTMILIMEKIFSMRCVLKKFY